MPSLRPPPLATADNDAVSSTRRRPATVYGRSSSQRQSKLTKHKWNANKENDGHIAVVKATAATGGAKEKKADPFSDDLEDELATAPLGVRLSGSALKTGVLNDRPKTQPDKLARLASNNPYRMTAATKASLNLAGPSHGQCSSPSSSPDRSLIPVAAPKGVRNATRKHALTDKSSTAVNIPVRSRSRKLPEFQADAEELEFVDSGNRAVTSSSLAASKKAKLRHELNSSKPVPPTRTSSVRFKGGAPRAPAILKATPALRHVPQRIVSIGDEDFVQFADVRDEFEIVSESRSLTDSNNTSSSIKKMKTIAKDVVSCTVAGAKKMFSHHSPTRKNGYLKVPERSSSIRHQGKEKGSLKNTEEKNDRRLIRQGRTYAVRSNLAKKFAADTSSSSPSVRDEFSSSPERPKKRTIGRREGFQDELDLPNGSYSVNYDTNEIIRHTNTPELALPSSSPIQQSTPKAEWDRFLSHLRSSSSDLSSSFSSDRSSRRLSTLESIKEAPDRDSSTRPHSYTDTTARRKSITRQVATADLKRAGPTISTYSAAAGERKDGKDMEPFGASVISFGRKSRFTEELGEEGLVGRETWGRGDFSRSSYATLSSRAGSNERVEEVSMV